MKCPFFTFSYSSLSGCKCCKDSTGLPSDSSTIYVVNTLSSLSKTTEIPDHMLYGDTIIVGDDEQLESQGSHANAGVIIAIVSVVVVVVVAVVLTTVVYLLRRRSSTRHNAYTTQHDDNTEEVSAEVEEVVEGTVLEVVGDEQAGIGQIVMDNSATL